MNGHEVRTGDFSVTFMFTPVLDVQIFVEAPSEAGSEKTNGFEPEVLNRVWQRSKCLFIHRSLKMIVTVHVDPIVAGTSEGTRMFLQLIGTELKVKENPAWSREAQVFLGANFS
eukprot:2817969-Amphidinium_carterae.1